MNQARSLDPDAILLSVGDFSGEPGILEMYRSRFLAEMLVRMRYSAVAVGERDLNHGIEPLRELAASGLPLICANMYQNGARVFPPSVVLTVRGMRIGVLALLGESPREPGGLEIADPASEGRRAARSLAKRCDAIVLIAHMERAKLVSILPSLESVDLVIRGHASREEGASETCADTAGGAFERIGIPVLFAGDRGRNLGSVAIRVRRAMPARVTASALVHLGEEVPDDPETASLVETFLQEEGARRREMQVKNDIAREEGTGKMRERYLGQEVCARCHGAIMSTFTVSRHFRAFETLASRGEERNDRCIGCHVTGYGRWSGYDAEREEKGGPNLRGVQCEACHGPGTLHARDGSYVRSARESCRSCHTSQWSPDFDFDLYWKRAAHCGRRDTTGAR